MPCTMSYWKAVAIAWDQLFNAHLGDWPDETLSSRAHRRREKGKPLLAKVIDALLWFDKDHCKESFESERKCRQLPPECRGKG